MSSWRTYRIADLGRVVTGKTPPSSQPELFDGPIPFITPSDMSFDHRHISTERFVSVDWDRKQRTLLPEGAVCVVCIGATIGKICMSSKPSQTNQQINSVIVDQTRFDQGFVYFGLRTKAGELMARAAGAATPIINKTAFSEVEIDAPPLETQRRIASILGAYDDLIEVNRRRIAVLEEMARGLFEEWFVRFRFPGHEAVPILDTPDGPVPEGWTWGTLGDLLSLPYGKALKADARRPGDVAVIGSSGVVGSHVEALVSGPGIVVGRKGNVGSVIWSATDFWPIDTTYYVDTRLPLTYVYQLLQRVPFENSHAAVPGLNREYAMARVVLIAPDALVQRYGAFGEPLMDQITTLERSNRSLAASRDLLLPRLISGQLSVAEAARELEEAA